MHAAAGQRSDSAAKKLRTLRWLIGLGLTAMVAVGLVLLFLLTQATTNQGSCTSAITPGCSVLNVVVACLLLLVIVWIAYRLLKRLQAKKFGSRLLVKLAAVFASGWFCAGRADLRGVVPVCGALN
jgi:nitrogen fixation/metabolism regulation signal transduction histidine kinase